MRKFGTRILLKALVELYGRLGEPLPGELHNLHNEVLREEGETRQ